MKTTLVAAMILAHLSHGEMPETLVFEYVTRADVTWTAVEEAIGVLLDAGTVRSTMAVGRVMVPSLVLA